MAKDTEKRETTVSVTVHLHTVTHKVQARGNCAHPNSRTHRVHMISRIEKCHSRDDSLE